MRVAIDANRYTDLCRGKEDVAEVVRQAVEILVPFIVLGELRAGFRLGLKSRRNEQILQKFLDSPRVTVLLADESTTHVYASLFAQLKSSGNPMPTNDLWIAALALQHDVHLCTRDKHFNYIPQLRRC